MAKKILELDEIINKKTVLLPELIAQTVVSNEGYQPEQLKLFIHSCVERFVRLYNLNPQFRGFIEGNKRDTVASFMAHWFKAYLINPQRYMENLDMVARIVHCGCCDCYHRVSYLGDCRDDSERFADAEDAGEKLQKFVIEI